MATEIAITTDRTQKFFDEIDAERTVLSSCTQIFTTLTTHFTSLQDSLIQRSQALDSKYQVLESDSQQTLESLSQREASISERESAAVVKVEELKQGALCDLEKPPKFVNLSDSLKSFSRKMDSSGLLKFVISKRKESASLRAEIPSAIMEAVDPVRLILASMDEFVNNKIEKVGVTDKRWACGMLVQALFPDCKSFDRKQKRPEFARSVVERAAWILEKWKREQTDGKEDRGRGGVVGSGEAVMFLQMVLGFGLKSRFSEDFLRKLVLEHAARRDMAKLAIAVGFGEKMGEIIDELVRNGKDLEAVYFATESGLAERFPPVPLLKSYLNNSRKNTTMILKNGNHSAAVKEESNAMELNSIRAIIKCVEDNKLESKFSLDGLRKRASELEKTKADKKKNAAAAAKPPSKRSHGASGGRGSGTRAFRPAKAAKFPNTYSPFGRRNPAPPAQHSPLARYSGPYKYPSQNAYDGQVAIPYGSSYGVSHPQSPAAIAQPSFSLPVDNTGFHASGQTTYGAYSYGSGAPPTQQPSPYAQ